MKKSHGLLGLGVACAVCCAIPFAIPAASTLFATGVGAAFGLEAAICAGAALLIGGLVVWKVAKNRSSCSQKKAAESDPCSSCSDQ